MNILKRIIRVMDIAVFVFTTVAIAGVFYEGMTLKWYDIVGIFVICMDYLYDVLITEYTTFPFFLF